MEQVRFIGLEVHSAADNMAIDEAILLSLEKEAVPATLRLYRWKPSAVSIGTFQGMRTEVDVDFCKSHGIDIIRRITGGGAVYHDYKGEITYSIILPKGHRLASGDIQASYGVLCSGIVRALKHLGIEAEFKQINDVITGGKKISGSAQTRRHSCVLQHGTALLDLDVITMFSILRVPQQKISDKMIRDVRERVTSIHDILGERVGFKDLSKALAMGFSEALEVELVSGRLTKQEKMDASRLAKQKYSSDAWNFLR
jgi:lipoate-protein ligase A